MSTTYTKTTTQNKLVISLDSNPFNPRENCNLGIFITDADAYFSIDKHIELQTALLSTSKNFTNANEWMDMYQKEAQTVVESPIIYIAPITMYGHEGIIKYLLDGTCTTGFVIVTQKTLDNIGVKKKDIRKQLQLELLEYNQYVNGEVYEYTLCNDDGDIEYSQSGFYTIDDMKDELPQEYKNLDLKQFLI